MILFQITGDITGPHESLKARQVFREDVRLSAGVSRAVHRRTTEQRLSLFGMVELAEPIQVDFEGKHLEVKWARYNVGAGCRGGKPVAVVQNLTLSTHKPFGEGGGGPELKVTLQSSRKKGSEYSVEFNSGGASGRMLMPNELADESIQRVLQQMPGLMKLVVESFTLRDQGEWPTHEPEKVADWLAKKNVTMPRFLTDLKEKLRHIELPGPK
jgi:hypothetical protein